VDGFIKCNTDGTARGSPGLSASGGVFQNSSGDLIGCFGVFPVLSAPFMLTPWLLSWP